eukprot:TRINITY_DN12107_c0_g1_i1.p1 TRINITY_DN12107_c0_g1~~TRINITY_DN12107_c0_g1_i1.p1  ORF type:complete len:328 (-),score=55.08 TRINITY_DN12107_c0_g1_i1:44-1027(-)
MAAVYTWQHAWNSFQPLLEALSVVPSIATEAIRQHLGKDPLVDSLFAALVFSAICWILSVLTQNYSWVDRLWSLLPPFYVIFFTIAHKKKTGDFDDRLLLMSAVTSVWGLRLTFNFARKGGYNPTSEDYRWAIIRKAIPEFVFQVFNVVFVALYQNILLWLIAAPAAYFAYVSSRSGSRLNVIDYTAAGLYVFLVTIETVADQQQWNFQTAKHKYIDSKQNDKLTGDFKRGFLTRGLFRFSRHPNFFAEISIWFVFYLFSVSSSGLWINWSLVGPVLLFLLFQGSTNFTEKISVEKYPQYKEYQQTTSRLIPLWPGKPLPEYNKKNN